MVADRRLWRSQEQCELIFISLSNGQTVQHSVTDQVCPPSPPPSQSCSTNGFPPAAAHRYHLAPGLNGGQRQRDALPLPVCRLQLSAGNTADVDILYFSHLKAHLKILSFSHKSTLRLIIRCTFSPKKYGMISHQLLPHCLNSVSFLF